MLVAPEGQGRERRTGRGGGGATCSGARSRASGGIRHASTRVANSSTFVALLERADGSEHPRPAIPEFGRFLERLKGWVDGPPVIEGSWTSGHTTCSGPTAGSPPFDRSGTVGAAAELTGRIYVA